MDEQQCIENKAGRVVSVFPNNRFGSGPKKRCALFDTPARVALIPRLSVRVHDGYVAGEGILHLAVFGLISMVNIRGTGVIGLSGGDGAVVLPLLATQILWINLVTDSWPALATGIDPPTDDVMARSRCCRWRSSTLAFSILPSAPCH